MNSSFITIKNILWLLLLILSCQSYGYSLVNDRPPINPPDVSAVPDAKPEPLPYSLTGNPPYYEVNGQVYHVLPTNKGYDEKGIASWYGLKFNGSRTSSGDIYDMYAMTAASPILPIPCFVRVTNLKNGKSVIVKVNDRGPFHDNRIMDLSYAAAKKLGIYQTGTGFVRIQAIDTSDLIDEPLSIYLQIASFSKEGNAKALVDKLQREVVQQKISIRTQSNANKTIFYRVVIGPLDTLKHSEQLQSVMIAQGLLDSHVIQLPQTTS